MKLFRRLILALSLSFASTSIHPRTAKTATMQLRGGGSLDPTTMAKVGMTISAAHGAYGVLAPSKNAEFLGAKPSDTVNFLMEGISTLCFRTATMAYLSILKDESVARTVGLAAIPHFVMQLKLFLNDETGVSRGGLLLDLAVVATIIYNCLAGSTEYADLAVKSYAAWGLLNGVGLFCFTEKVAEAWGIKGDALVMLGVKGVGQMILSTAAMIFALSQGESALKAYGYYWATNIITMSYIAFVSKELDKLNMKKGPQTFYLVLNCVMAAALLLYKEAEPVISPSA